MKPQLKVVTKSLGKVLPFVSGCGLTYKVPKNQKQIWLDVGCGERKQANSVGMDRRAIPGVDVVHDVEVFPWPFEDDVFSHIVMSHVMEHIKPWLSIDVMNEMWRIMRMEGQLMMAMPYPGSYGHWQDPTHIRPWNEATALYFDPDREGSMWGIYKPKPWKLEMGNWRNDGNISFVFSKRGMPK